MHRPGPMLIAITLLLAVTACNGADPTPAANPTTDSSIVGTDTSPAGGEPVLDRPLVAPGAQAGLWPEDISLETQGLPFAWQAVVVPPTPYDKSQPPGPKGLPEHVQVLFGVSEPDQRTPADPVMYIIPVDAYRNLWLEADDPAVSTAIQSIEQLSFSLPSPPATAGMPALPYEEIGAGNNDLAVQVGRAIPAGQMNETSAAQTGYRFVGRWAQDLNPITNQGLWYSHQGFTNDGRYLVSFWYPVTTDQLPNDAGEVTPDEMSALADDSEAYFADRAEFLNGLTSDQFAPDLATLDSVVASLQILGMPIAGLHDRTWLWRTGPVQPGSDETGEIAVPENYAVVYGSDGAIHFLADCNQGSMSYELTSGGMAGSMLAQPEAATLADCGPESLSQGFTNSLMAAQTYRVRAGGGQLELVLPAGGGLLELSDAGPSSEPDAP